MTNINNCHRNSETNPNRKHSPPPSGLKLRIRGRGPQGQTSWSPGGWEGHSPPAGRWPTARGWGTWEGTRKPLWAGAHVLWREASRVMGSAWHGHRCTHTHSRIHTHPPHMTHTCAQPSHVHAPCTHRHTLTCVCVVHTQVVPHKPRPGPCSVRTLRRTRARSRAHTRCSSAHLATLPARCRGNGMASR